MRIDFDTTLTAFDGSPLPDDAEGTLTLKTVAVTALLSTLADGRGHPESLPPASKVEHALLAQTIHGGGVIDLTAEQVALLKDRVGRAYAPIVVMRAWALLDPVAPAEAA